MSRYFTSPPPVYARNWGNGQNLVESTKIESQIVDSKKAHRKEKKEKKREKKVKNDKSLKKKHISQTKQVSDESEQLEKSCLTDEHEHEQHHQVGYLSDGSQKRRREVKATPVAGNPLRIRFVFKKPKEAEVVSQEDRVCSTSEAERPSEISSAVSCHDEKLLSTSLESEKIALPSESKKRKKHKTSKESRYISLFDELVPSCISLEDDNSSSDDWLFGTRRQENASTSNYDDRTMSLQIPGDCSLPRARFLSEVGIFSLPYTVPF